MAPEVAAQGLVSPTGSASWAVGAGRSAGISATTPCLWAPSSRRPTGSVVVAPDSGEQRTIRTDDSTRVRGGGNTGLADLEAGERVVIRVAGAGDAATAVSILTSQARVIGTVTALSGDLATITSIDGRTVTANLSALTEQPAVGDLIALTGTATNPTTITATTLTPVRG